MAMPRIRKKQGRKDGSEYRFLIDAYTPDTMPMVRLAQYMHELSQLLGEPGAVHFRRLEPGSTALISTVDREATPKVRERVVSLRRGEPPKEVRAAYEQINRLLRADDAVGVLIERKAATKPTIALVIRFPGREAVHEEFPAIRQQGSVDGIVTGIRGRDETIHVTLQSEGQQISGCYTTKTIAKQLATKFLEPVRLFGRGRWARDAEGTWNLIDFKIESFEGLIDVPLSTALADIRSIAAEWTDEAYNELNVIRHGREDKQNGGH
jgi:hypothetical protein